MKNTSATMDALDEDLISRLDLEDLFEDDDSDDEDDDYDPDPDDDEDPPLYDSPYDDDDPSPVGVPLVGTLDATHADTDPSPDWESIPRGGAGIPSPVGVPLVGTLDATHPAPGPSLHSVIPVPRHGNPGSPHPRRPPLSPVYRRRPVTLPHPLDCLHNLVEVHVLHVRRQHPPVPEGSST